MSVDTERVDGGDGGSPWWPRQPHFEWRLGVRLYAVFAAGVAAATWPLVLNPATLWPPHHDARVFTWVMGSMARRLYTHPLSLFHGNAFYPFGESLAFTEPLLPPTLVGFPGFLWGNPILTYNLLLLALWPLNGVAMAWVAHRLTGSRPAAWLAGSVFCLSPYFTEYYLEFQMLLAPLLPMVLFAWVEWLETQEHRWLGIALGGLTVQALTTWYYAIILGLALPTLALGFLCLRWRGWRWRRILGALAVGAVVMGAALWPLARPYLIVRRELGYERGLTETSSHSADVASFLESNRRSWINHFAPTGHIAETALFPGFIVVALAGASLVWLPGSLPRPVAAAWMRRIALTGLGATLAALGWVLAFPQAVYRLGPLAIRPQASLLLYGASVLGLILLAIRGFAVTRVKGPRRLDSGDWVRLLLLLTAVFGVLALGPVIHVARREIGAGPYQTLYQVLAPLHALRVTVRFAVMTLCGLALLAALGLTMIERRLRDRPGSRRLVLAVVFLALGLEYAVKPPDFESVAWADRPVDLPLRADPADVAILEFPVGVAESDADAMVRSLRHGKRLLNGLSGFVPSFIRRLSQLLTTPATPFPSPEAQATLRRIYPLRYLVVRLADRRLPDEWRPVWRALRQDAPPLLRFRGTFGNEDLYEIVPLPERGRVLERWVSYDLLHARRRLRLELRPLVVEPDLGQWVDVRLNRRLVARLPLDQPPAPVLLSGPLRRAAPNVIELRHRHARGRRAPETPGGSTGSPPEIGLGFELTEFVLEPTR